MAPILSVIIPAYNEQALIQACLRSLLKQDLNKRYYEVIVIDNASTDQTAKVAKKYPVKVVRELKRSVVAARQKGVGVSRGEIIVSADADTIYPPNWLSQIKKNFENNKKLVAVVGWIYYKNTPPVFNIINAINQEINLLLLKVTSKFPIAYAANFAFRKCALEAIGGYPQHLVELGDQQYLLYKFFKLGKVTIDPYLKCFTSERKLRSIWKNILLYNGWHRIIGYLVNRIAKKEVIGPSPAVRSIPSQKSHS